MKRFIENYEGHDFEENVGGNLSADEILGETGGGWLVAGAQF